ncbi:hypothetical protein NDU88_002429 [Pleurodeles waltl]|uniref:Uncharacterized protein n=1 Tax=Pleurodeles waltl TaxID=8319 RepID=A0AAV7Q5Z7_PLEWA|nr:hypothetical protein NDU88_002429 [Pleurodeles waltl]
MILVCGRLQKPRPGAPRALASRDTLTNLMFVAQFSSSCFKLEAGDLFVAVLRLHFWKQPLWDSRHQILRDAVHAE